MTGGEGFAKVIPAAFGFSLVRSSFSESIVLLPHLHINFKLPKESNHHGNIPLLVSVSPYTTFLKDWRLGVLLVE
jgi:5-hydroxyisourate hydrolase-like protein (transthyretin family)